MVNKIGGYMDGILKGRIDTCNSARDYERVATLILQLCGTDELEEVRQYWLTKWDVFVNDLVSEDIPGKEALK
jgi:hypothetical protein